MTDDHPEVPRRLYSHPVDFGEAVLEEGFGASSGRQPKSKSIISRRKFICWLATLPFVGELLLDWKLASPRFIPPGFVQCRVCGEYNGRTDSGNLGKDAPRPPTSEIIIVSCLCHGRPCPDCGKMLQRPISNQYNPGTNSISHQPYFAGWFSCAECERRRKDAWDNMPTAEKKRVIAERDRKLDDAGWVRVSDTEWMFPGK